MAATDPSSLVRLVLASTMQRMPFSQRLAVASGLVTHKEDATDKNIPLMVWYALIPIAETNPPALASIAAKSELRATSKYVARRLAEDITARPGPVDTLVAAAATRSAEYQADIVDGLTLGLQGQQGVREAGRVGRVREEAPSRHRTRASSERCGRWMRRSVAPGHSRRPAGSPLTTRRRRRLAGRRCSRSSTRARLTCARSPQQLLRVSGGQRSSPPRRWRRSTTPRSRRR